MNSLFLNFDEGTDTNAVYTKLKELFPNVKKTENIQSVTVLKEFADLVYKDDEMDVKFEFKSPHIVKMIYHGDEFVSIDDDEFHIYAVDKTEEEAILDYICELDFLWERYATGKVTNIGNPLKENIETIKSKVKKLW